MLLYLINPVNPLVGITKVKDNRWNKYRVWKPLSLLVLAGLTPSEWEIKVIDENLGTPDYAGLPKPDLVGITAFTSQAARAYKIADEFRQRNVPVVMGGIHATIRLEEALERVDSVVTGEAESIWEQVLEDAKHGCLGRVYKGVHMELDHVPPARHDLARGYHIGSIQTTRGCPLNCSFCSVTPFNGRRHRHRPIENVIEELKLIPEKHVLFVDDNLTGTRKDHIQRTKELFRAMIEANIKKKWFSQATINMADDDELIRLAAKSGCLGVFIGFESPSLEGLIEVNKKFNVQNDRDLRASVRRIQRHGIMVVGSFILGLDVDEKGIGRQIADAANSYGLDLLNLMFLTPFPGTRLWDKMESEGRIIVNNFPEDWTYYTLTYPVAKYKNLTWSDMIEENEACFRSFYSVPRIAKRIFTNRPFTRHPFFTAVSNMSVITNAVRFYRRAYQGLDLSRGQ